MAGDMETGKEQAFGAIRALLASVLVQGFL